MGISYYVACRDCRVCRDVDKLRPEQPATRTELLKAAERLNAFRAAMVVGFMAEHQGHNCTMFNDAEDQDDPDNYQSNDSDFWEMN